MSINVLNQQMHRWCSAALRRLLPTPPLPPPSCSATATAVLEHSCHTKPSHLKKFSPESRRCRAFLNGFRSWISRQTENLSRTHRQYLPLLESWPSFIADAQRAVTKVFTAKMSHNMFVGRVGTAPLSNKGGTPKFPKLAPASKPGRVCSQLIDPGAQIW